jgi:2'-5' RNA ligase
VRCFVALPVDRAASLVLAQLGNQLTAQNTLARRLDAADLHLTLAFIGDLPDSRARELAASIEDGFDDLLSWMVDRVGEFPRARVLWVAGAAIPALGALAQGVRSLLSSRSVPFDARLFVPHITLARSFRAKVPLPERLSAPVVCRLGPPQLMASQFGSQRQRYRRVAREEGRA